jgi:hypothetical protein
MIPKDNAVDVCHSKIWPDPVSTKPGGQTSGSTLFLHGRPR